MNKFEIWIGNHNLGQGYHQGGTPIKVGEIEATSFKIACCIYEHQKSIDCLSLQMNRGDTYIEDAHFGAWYYDPKTNSNSWTGEYFENKEDALKSY